MPFERKPIFVWREEAFTFFNLRDTSTIEMSSQDIFQGLLDNLQNWIVSQLLVEFDHGEKVRSVEQWQLCPLNLNHFINDLTCIISFSFADGQVNQISLKRVLLLLRKRIMLYLNLTTTESFWNELLKPVFTHANCACVFLDWGAF